MTQKPEALCTGCAPEVKCLPDCDEWHVDGCPVFEAEKKYWAAYFGVGTPAFKEMAPLDNKWCPACRRVLKVSRTQVICPVCDREELQ